MISNINNNPTNNIFPGTGTDTPPTTAAILDLVRVVANHTTNVTVPTTAWNANTNTNTNTINTQIPQHIFFTYKVNLLTTDKNADAAKDDPNFVGLQDNVLKIVDMHPEYEITFLDDADCERYIAHNYSRELSAFFVAEKAGMYKADICRLVVLYNEGGYYMDSDLGMVRNKPVQAFVHPNASFVTALDYAEHSVFQAFIGTVAQHKILEINLQYFLEYYRKDRQLAPGYLLGPGFMKDAIKSWIRTSVVPSISIHEVRLNGLQTFNVQLLLECDMNHERPRMHGCPAVADDEHAHGNLHYFVFDPNSDTKELLFWSRIAAYQSLLFN